MTVRHLHTVARPFEVYRELDTHSFNLVQNYRDELLDEMTLLNDRAVSRAYYNPSYGLPEARLKRVEIASNEYILTENYERHLKGTPKQLGEALQYSLNEQVDYDRRNVQTSTSFITNYQRGLRFGILFDRDETMVNAANRTHATLSSLCLADVQETPPYLYLGTILYSGKIEHTKTLLYEAQNRTSEALGRIVLNLGPVMFAGEIFEPLDIQY